MRVVQIGLGPIGRSIARRVHQTPGLTLVGAVDPDPALAGRPLGELLRTEGLEARVVALVDDLPSAARPELATQSTGSALAAVAPQLRELVGRGLGVVSTCEELAYPFYRHPQLSRELDARAREAGVVLLGTGINPGFVMDKLPATLMAACASVRAVRVTRVVDASRRREPFQRKIGAGLTPAAFERGRAEGRLGHVGLLESAHMLADVIGVPAEGRESEEGGRAILAERRLLSEFIEVEVGQVAGLEQEVVIRHGGAERVRLEIRMALEAGRPHDAISIDGSPPLEMMIPSGVPGDEGTAAVVLNSLACVASLAPGLRTMLDVPIRLAPRGAAAPSR